MIIFSGTPISNIWVADVAPNLWLLMVSACIPAIVGGVKCQPFLKHSNHWKRALMIFKESGCFLFPEAVVSSTGKESLRSTERGSLQVLAVL